MRRRGMLGLMVVTAVIGAACSSSEPATQPTPNPPAVPQGIDGKQLLVDPGQLMAAALSGAYRRDSTAILSMGATGDVSYIPVLMEFLRLPWLLDDSVVSTIGVTMSQLAGIPQDELPPDLGDWNWWVEWIGKHSEILPPAGYASWKGQFFSRHVDPAIGNFFRDGLNSRIRLEEIVWGGVPKDGIPDLTNPPVVSPEEATYLEPSDRVFGVSLGGEHRAYPLRILNAHEMANDVVGGVPFALAY